MLVSTKTRVLYCAFYVVVLVLAGVARLPELQLFLESITLEQTACLEIQECTVYGLLTTFKLAMALAIYHGLLALLTVGASDSRHQRASFHNGKWLIKLLLFGAILIGVWFIPNTFFIGFSVTALAGSAGFALAQTALLFEFSDIFVSPYQQRIVEDEDRKSFALLLLFSLLLFGITIGLSSVLYIHYSNCGLDLFFITFNLVLVFCMSFISLLPGIQASLPQIGLFHAALVGAYLSFLVWSAIILQPDSFECVSKEADQLAVNVVARVFGGIFLVLSMWNIAFSRNSENIEATPLINSSGSDERIPDVVIEEMYSYSKFHQLLVAASFYMAMIVSDWTLLTGPYLETIVLPDQGEAAMWVKMAASWVGFLIYLGMAIIPMIRDRD